MTTETGEITLVEWPQDMGILASKNSCNYFFGIFFKIVFPKSLIFVWKVPKKFYVEKILQEILVGKFFEKTLIKSSKNFRNIFQKNHLIFVWNMPEKVSSKNVWNKCWNFLQLNYKYTFQSNFRISSNLFLTGKFKKLHHTKSKRINVERSTWGAPRGAQR